MRKELIYITEATRAKLAAKGIEVPAVVTPREEQNLIREIRKENARRMDAVMKSRNSALKQMRAFAGAA